MRPDIYGILGSFGIFTRNLNIAPLFQTKRGCCAWVCTGSSAGGSVGLRIWIFCSLPAKPCRTVASTFNQIFNMLRAEVEHFVPARIFDWTVIVDWWQPATGYVVIISCIDPLLFFFSFSAYLLLSPHLEKNILYVPSVRWACFVDSISRRIGSLVLRVSPAELFTADTWSKKLWGSGACVVFLMMATQFVY